MIVFKGHTPQDYETKRVKRITVYCKKCKKSYTYEAEDRDRVPMKKRNSNRPMTRSERGSWIDTEGYIGTTPRPHIEIVQIEREPLEDYCEGARIDGVRCGIYEAKLDKETRYRAIITGIENVAKEISVTRNSIRNKRKKKQIDNFITYLKLPQRRIEAERARKIPKV